MTQLCPSVPVSQHAHYQNPETEAAKLNFSLFFIVTVCSLHQKSLVEKARPGRGTFCVALPKVSPVAKFV